MTNSNPLTLYFRLNLTAKSLARAELEASLSSIDGVDAAAFERFKEAAQSSNLIPLFQRILSDHLTPVLAYRCLVSEDERTAPSFLFESVMNGSQQVRLALKCSNVKL